MFNVEYIEGCPGEIAKEVVGVRGLFLPEFDDLSFPVLRLIDPYDDTVFNRCQTRVLLEEWSRVEAKARESGEHRHWREIRDLAQKVAAEPLRYLRFIGD
jgi:hypothetical protein